MVMWEILAKLVELTRNDPFGIQKLILISAYRGFSILNVNP